jgi:hypothetical protein
VFEIALQAVDLSLYLMALGVQGVDDLEFHASLWLLVAGDVTPSLAAQ